MATFTDYRGRKWHGCACQVKWLKVYQAELLRLGVIKHGLDIYQLIGLGSKSGGTHAGGGASDTGQTSELAIHIAREMGADGSWHRRRNWDGKGGMEHAHLVLRGCKHNGPARYQITAVDADYNGLGYMGRAAHDDGPRPLSKRTWQQGIAWAKARQRVARTRTTEFEIYLQNCAADHANWSGRAPIISGRVKLFAPHFVSAVELFDDKRPTLSRRLLPTYKLAGYEHGKVQYGRVNVRGWVKVGNSRGYDLGHGKHAVAVHWRHRTTGAEFVLVTQHLSWQHDAAANRKDEETRLLGFLKRDFPGLPRLVTGDYNDSEKSIKTRPVDTSGKVLKDAGMHDLYGDVAEKWRTNEEYNTANQDVTPPPTAGVHIDRAVGDPVFEGLAWTLDVVHGTRPADHWGLRLKIRLTHPKK